MLLDLNPPDPQGGLILGLTTKLGTRIPNIQRLRRPPESMEAAQQIVLGGHRSAKTRSLSSEYNCAGMVFAARRTWIDDEHVGMILREDGYRKLDNPSEAVLGDVVVYRNDGGEISHVGILVSVQLQLEVGGQELTVLSQWGADGEYFHRIDDVNPRLGQPTEIWTDRK